jgi:hypothetical protein
MTMKRGGRVLMLGVLLVGCSDPCETLSERVCTDLGADCGVWRAGVDQTFLPQVGTGYRRNALMGRLLKQRPEDSLCRAMGEDGNYQGYSLPQVRYLVKMKKDPASAGAAPKLQKLVMGSGYPPWLMYALAPLSILGMMLYVWFNNRRARAGGAPG